MNMFDWPLIPSLLVSKTILSDWENLLNDTSLKERHYHEHLRQTSGLFFGDWKSCLIISKMKLGSDHETDFVIVKDGHSDGTEYELVEIETPHTKLFDNRGYPTAAFNASLQQVRDWRRWLMNNKHQFKQILPTVTTRMVTDSKIKFRIVIGRRTDNANVIEKRKQIAEENNVTIMSYDRLTEYIKRRPYNTMTWLQSGNQYDEEMMANPFAVSLSDSEWRSICKKGGFHIHSFLCEDVLRLRTYNKYYEMFDHDCDAYYKSH